MAISDISPSNSAIISHTSGNQISFGVSIWPKKHDIRIAMKGRRNGSDILTNLTTYILTNLTTSNPSTSGSDLTSCPSDGVVSGKHPTKSLGIEGMCLFLRS